ncbi:MAG: class I SAM-dependent methyltransferase [Nitrospiraceae bacterium]|nr:class I SAM-dependent methyltransferase [Nitrospiraceae bacterium]
MNRFDSYCPDIRQLLKEQGECFSCARVETGSDSGMGLVDRYVKYPLRLKFVSWLKHNGIYDFLLRTHVLTGWFDEFRRYWVGELGNRPVNIHDFYFLQNLYRMKFQDLGLDVEEGYDLHLKTWQSHKTVYLLFQSQFRHRGDDFSRYMRFIKKGARVLEYGCGIAPVTAWLSSYTPHLKLRLSFADIATLNFHYARWRLREKPFAKAIEINPDDDFPLAESYDAIFLFAVLEHLPRPMRTVEHLFDKLNLGGCLIFDYVKSEGKGLDSMAALHERDKVLKWLSGKLEVIDGELRPPFDKLSTIVCRKK